MYRVRINSQGAEDMLARVQAALAPEAIDPVIQLQAHKAHAELVKATPKRFFGQVRREWTVEKISPGAYRVANPNPIMGWLEYGTGHSTGGFIYPKNAKALFVALTRRAALADRRFFGQTCVSQTAGFSAAGAVSRSTRGMIVRKSTGSQTLVYGIDYVLAKRVRGLKAMKIVERMRRR
jgi:hypothetical protein